MPKRHQPQEYQGALTRNRARLQNKRVGDTTKASPNRRSNVAETTLEKENTDFNSPPRKRKRFNNALITPESNKRLVNTRVSAFIPKSRGDSSAVGQSHGHATGDPSSAGLKQTGSTPFKFSTHNAQSIVSRGYSTTELQSTRRLDAKTLVDDYLLPDITGLLDLAAPDSKAAEETASRLAVDISTLLEELLLLKSSQVSTGGRRGHGGKGVAGGKQRVQQRKHTQPDIIFGWMSERHRVSSTSRVSQTQLKAAANILSKRFDRLKKWIDTKRGTGKESDLYEPISQLFHFVAGCIKSVNKALPVHPERLIVPFFCPDRKSADGDDESRVDLVLNIAGPDSYIIGTPTNTPSSDNSKLPMFLDAFSVIEVKREAQGVKRALPQLFQYTRGIYAEQYNRRFAWGLAVGGKQVQAVFFGPSYALASPSMDIGQRSGLEQLIRLLVDWSFCESHKLGYDPTISFNKQSRYYEIQVGQGGKMETYYSQGAVIGVERLFGRHTRCFVASKTKPRSNVEFKPEVFIKDAWPEATSDAEEDHRDESRHLNKITAILGDDKSLDGKYPKYLSGGRVHMKRQTTTGQSTDVVEDNSRSIISDSICSQLDTALKERAPPLRAHKRICMEGIGEPLKCINSVPELICVMADAMECHWEIYKRCGILHRDISTNNILFTGSGSRIKGMLIDFDHAFCESDKNAVHHFERTGTLPFMSVNNLEGEIKMHTVLDDWESLLYILCWLGTYGWRNKRRSDGVGPDIPQGRVTARADNSKASASRQTTRTRYLKSHSRAEPGFKEISRWFTGELSTCALNKRRDLKDSESFKLITDQFDKDIPLIESLRSLVHGLRRTLIDDHKDNRMKGAMKRSEVPEEQDDYDDVFGMRNRDINDIDPFQERMTNANDIAESLFKNMKKVAEQARVFIRKGEIES
ncbi:hypothetical protein IWW48_001147 [Coemansia sp. RSA 1200]|nr:hypothetical protein IWW48_001147 [Coemansia sp. RSA 1200]